MGIEDGAVAHRDALLESIGAGALRFPKIESFPDEAVVRLVGSAGVVVGRTSMNVTNPDGTDFTAASRYIHVFAHDGQWRLHSAQGTAIRAEAGAE
ncbi:hypothetical protein GCM10022419_136030 [Nonomuraea rosea]|uniref:DUF4440 domain-containing protein n=1 Tax=Nonomuraea rosea TaxID=638574 RepID=A0ABP7A982_9ACTN